MTLHTSARSRSPLAPTPDIEPSVATKPANRAGRPSQSEQIRRENLVLDIALDELLSQGLEGTNIETIARKAGVGKTTIYRKYENKQGLMLAVISRHMDEQAVRWTALALEVHDPEGSLYRIALMSYLEWSGISLPLFRIASTEAARMPHVALAFYNLAMRKAIAPVTDYFQKLMDGGVIEVEDVAEAASMFLTIAVGGTRFLILPADLDDTQKDQMARRAVRSFLYGCAKLGAVSLTKLRSDKDR